MSSVVAPPLHTGRYILLEFLFLLALVFPAHGQMVDLGTLGGTNSYATAVSNGQVVGQAETGEKDHYGTGISRAFSWTAAGGMVDVGTIGKPWAHWRSKATAVDNGQVVGWADTGVWDGPYTPHLPCLQLDGGHAAGGAHRDTHEHSDRNTNQNAFTNKRADAESDRNEYSNGNAEQDRHQHTHSYASADSNLHPTGAADVDAEALRR